MKITAYQVNPEHQESPLYFDEYIPNDVFLYGNRRLIDRSGRLEDIHAALEAIADEYDDMQNGYGSTTNLHAAIWYEMPRDNGRPYTRAERLCIVDAAHRWRDDGDDDAVCDALRVVTGQEWECTEIHGCCQGDWQGITYPAAYGREWLRCFEAEYFNTGTEYRIRIGNDDDGGEYMYTHATGDDRAEIARAYGVPEDDVTVYAFDGYDMQPRYREVV